MASPIALAGHAGQVAGAVRPLSTPAATSAAPGAVASPSAAASWYPPAEPRRSRWTRRRARTAAVVSPASWFAAQSRVDTPGAAGRSATRTQGLA